METIYWIQRLGMVNAVAWVFFGLSIIGILVCTIMMVCNYEYIDTLEGSEKEYKIGKRGLKASLWTFFISLLIGIFVPTTSELYAIYGIGGTIDYIKGNDTAKQLPDKVINALDAWIDNQTENNKDK